MGVDTAAERWYREKAIYKSGGGVHIYGFVTQSSSAVASEWRLTVCRGCATKDEGGNAMIEEARQTRKVQV